MRLKNSLLSDLAERFGVETDRIKELKATWESRMESILGPGEIRMETLRLLTSELDCGYVTGMYYYTGDRYANLSFVQKDKSTWSIHTVFDPKGNHLVEYEGHVKGFIIDPNLEHHRIERTGLALYDVRTDKIHMVYDVLMAAIL